MATLTFNPLSLAESGSEATEAKPSFFSRFLGALAESRQRQAEIEIRRVRALYGEPNEKLDYALLPFAGE